jgi:SRSO17 transposase
LADYQALGWQAWHHHVTMVMLATVLLRRLTPAKPACRISRAIRNDDAGGRHVERP